MADPATEKVSDDEVTERLAQLGNWTRDGDEIVREWRFVDFVSAIGFITQVGVLAEKADHHPHITNVYNQVTLRLTTHDAGGLTRKDFDLARQIEDRVP